ncbi:MAG: NB-ARC domain-containing protein, partial [Anaerolineae bacterium]|nr:NB-ARC domain-containing protein [Anaerolineae bacterium]MCO5207912.1 NB-ARC domain-containing protein [Anaerolineae bacterium]
SDIAQADDGTIFMTPALPPHDIIGRDELLATLKQQLFVGRNVALSAINGLPGVGKTTLAVLLAHDADVRAHFPDGVLWVGLGRDPDVFHQLGVWAEVVGVDSAELERMGALKLRANAIHAAIRDKQMLIVIDDVWDDSVVPLFKLGGTQCTHILTTRQPRIAAGFAGVHALKVAELSEQYAFELLRQLAPRVVEQEPEAAREIVKATGGLPLALVLIGNHLRIQAATGQGRRIRSALAQLQSAENRFHIQRAPTILEDDVHPSLADDTPISLATIIGVSDQELGAEAQAALRAVALFPPKPNSFAEEATLFVAATTTDVLDELSDHGLLETVGRDRYTLHQSINDFAQLQPVDPQASSRLSIFYKQFVTAHAADHDVVGRELENIEAALAAAARDKRYQLLWELLDAVFPFLEIRGHYDLAHDYLTALDLDALSAPIQARVHYQFGRIALRTNQNDTAQAQWEAGLEIARAAQAHAEAVVLLSNLSVLISQNRDYERTTSMLQEAIVHAQLAEDWYELGRAHANLGRFAYIRDDYVAAEGHYATAYDLAVQHEFRDLTCAVLNLRGLNATNLGAFAAARTYFEEGLHIARENRFTNRLLGLLVNIGQFLNETGHYAESIIYMEEGLDLARRFGDQAKESNLLKNLGVADAKLGSYERAEERFIAADAIAVALENQWLVATIAVHYGIAAVEVGDLSQATALFSKCLNLTPSINNEKPLVALAYYGLAQIAVQEGREVAAADCVTRSLDALADTNHALISEIHSWREANGV